MGISFGSTGIKPYVGNKEIQEAYVGSQLVYRATPPYVYAFLGGENDYVLASWVTLGRNASIQKADGIYRISIKGGDSYATPGLITMSITELANKNKISLDYTNSVDSASILFNNGSPVNLGKKSTWTHVEANIPAGTNTISIKCHNTTGLSGGYLRLDAIRIE